MTQNGNDLSVRQHKRYQCDLASRVRLDSADASAIRFSPAASPSPVQLESRVTDTSHGGLGLSSPVYIPSGTRLMVTMDIDGHERRFQVRVQRVRMTDRTPLYYIGTSFVGTSAEHASGVDALLASCAKAEGAASAQR